MKRRSEQRNLGLRPGEVPDVEICGSVRAREIRWGTVPETRVWADGEPGVRASAKSEREGLPDQVEPGVTYRDVRVRWHAGASIDHPTDPDET